MRHIWSILPLLLAVSATVFVRAAERPVPKEPRLSGSSFVAMPEAPHLSLRRQPSGEPILVVHYPWHRHQHPSIEMRLLEPKDREPSAWKPIFFVANYLKEDAIRAIRHCLDHGEDLPAKATFTHYAAGQKVQFEVTGQRNALERASVVIHGLSELEGPRSGNRLVFCPLEPWALDRHTLWLELPTKDASKPCRIRVWFLRHDDIVWEETLAWPGYPQASPPKPEGPPKVEEPQSEAEDGQQPAKP